MVMASTDSEETINVLFYGLGAIGSVYAFILSRCPNVRLTTVARSNYDAVRENGLKLISENHGEHTFYPANVIKTPSEAPGHYDYIVCSNKAIDQELVAKALAPIISTSTSIVLIQNGVGNEEIFQKLYPQNSIISCVAWTGAIQKTPGIVHHTKNENLQLGLFRNDNIPESSSSQRLKIFDDLLTTGKTPHEVFSPERLQIARWEKVTWNCAWNCLTTLTRTHTHEWLNSSPEAMKMTRTLMQEVITVGKKMGVGIKDDLIERLMERILRMPSIGTSMLTDALCGRRLELDVILGFPVKKGRELGLDMRVCETVYTLLLGVDEGLRVRGLEG
ncbi:e06b987b-e64a-4461-a470-5792bf000a29 [Sclerotinia trifoliorum]|uniref:2-dehydropantoate 2-reductase n=1 Tax=Sclerotinia trifoliorum TaxID=28548 RepID=A0A8H2ZNP8_9HELO|nr:e06b987b-e64a-4461-a470-5792bf000a29 [Sclerotinia trifoliorum]